MLMFPHVAQKIQKELHEVVGVDRLPKIDDRANLPYLEAAWKESLRWSPIIPIGNSSIIGWKMHSSLTRDPSCHYEG